MGPVSSVNWMINFLGEPETEDGWWHIETKETATANGYSSQIMRFWNASGDLVAEGMQSVAIFV
jgi:acyl-CoA thioesterase